MKENSKKNLVVKIEITKFKDLESVVQRFYNSDNIIIRKISIDINGKLITDDLNCYSRFFTENNNKTIEIKTNTSTGKILTIKEYDKKGRLIKIEDRQKEYSSLINEIFYDKKGRIEYKNSYGIISIYKYDTNDKNIAIISTNNRVSLLYYDYRGNKTKEVINIFKKSIDMEIFKQLSTIEELELEVEENKDNLKDILYKENWYNDSNQIIKQDSKTLGMRLLSIEEMKHESCINKKVTNFVYQDDTLILKEKLVDKITLDKNNIQINHKVSQTTYDNYGNQILYKNIYNDDKETIHEMNYEYDNNGRILKSFNDNIESTCVYLD